MLNDDVPVAFTLARTSRTDTPVAMDVVATFAADVPVAVDDDKNTGADAPAAREMLGVSKEDVPEPASTGLSRVVAVPDADVVPVIDLLIPIFSMVTLTISALLFPTRISFS